MFVNRQQTKGTTKLYTIILSKNAFCMLRPLHKRLKSVCLFSKIKITAFSDGFPFQMLSDICSLAEEDKRTFLQLCTIFLHTVADFCTKCIKNDNMFCRKF